MNSAWVYDKLNSMNDKDFIENFLLINISQVLSGIKPASTICLKKDKSDSYNKWLKYGIGFIRVIGLEFIELRANKELVVLLIYNKDNLKKSILKDENKMFLRNLGYHEGNNIQGYIYKLKERYELYHCPHELGLFLGIPIKDVKDFMNCTEKKCLLCGYWKVYNDDNTAKQVFSLYDEVKMHTYNEILKGSNSRNLAFSIKNFFCTLL